MTRRLRRGPRLLASRWLLPAVLALGACSSPTYSEVQEEWPAVSRGSGRIVFLGDNYGWYGIFEGVSWNPVISIDGRVLAVDNGTGVYFMIEVPTGKRYIAVNGQEQISVFVEANATKYIEMQRYAEVNNEFGLRKINYKLRLQRIDEARARLLLDEMDFIGIVE